MAKAFVQFVSKTHSLYPSRVEVDTEVVPRAGELVRSQGLGLLPDSDPGKLFVVLSVVYDLTPDGFLPLLTAQEWSRGLRAGVLAERGWLPPDKALETVYDDDDVERCHD